MTRALSRLKSLLQEHYEWVVGVLCGLGTLALFKVAEDVWHFSISIQTHLLAEVVVTFLVSLVLRHREGAHQGLVELTQETRALHNAMNSALESAVHANRITENFHAIQIESTYDAATNEAIRSLEFDQGTSLVAGFEKTTTSIRDLIGQEQHWRVILERILGALGVGVSRNLYTMSLETYCNVIIDTIKTGVLKDSGEQLVVASFTNVTPKDWFLEREVIGNPLQGYARKVAEAVSAMKANGHSFRRFVMCRDSTANGGDGMLGFPSVSEVKLDWINCDRNKRHAYLNEFHTQPEFAEVLAISIPSLKLYQNCTEFVFFGFSSKDAVNQKLDSVKWWWCFCAGYTRNNVNVSASFIDLTSRGSGDVAPLIIDSPNTSQLVDADTHILSQRIRVPFRDFPKFILGLTPNFATRHRFENLLTLASKWHLAAEIWHSENEQDILLQLLSDEFRQEKDKVQILDCACGTGFHAALLKEQGFSVTASDKDGGNLDICRRAFAAKNISIETLRVDWAEMEKDLGGRLFDAILCVGSSLPYYKSWVEDGSAASFDNRELRAIIVAFRARLKGGGKLIIGLSRMINRKYSESSVTFKDVPVRGSLSGAPDGTYSMKWHFLYDWKSSVRHWHSEIRNSEGDDYSFDLESHLFDIHDLLAECLDVFGPGNARIEDPGTDNYDIYVVCTSR